MIQKCTLLLFYLFHYITIAQNTDYLTKIDDNYNEALRFYYTNQDSAYFYFNKTKTLAKKHNDIDYLITALISENWCSNYYYDLNLTKNNLSQLDSVLLKNKTIIDTLPEKAYYSTTIKYCKGLYHYELKNYENSKKYFEELIANTDTLQDLKSNPDILNLYLPAHEFLGKIYSDEKKYKLALQFYEKNLRTIKSLPEINSVNLNSTQNLIADIYEKEGRYKQANTILLQNLKYYTTDTKNKNRIISLYQNVIANHLKLKQNDSAIYYLKKMKNTLPEKHPFWYRYFIIKSKIHEANNNYHLAQAELKKALLLTKAKWKNQPHQEVANIYNTIGLLHTTFKTPEKALENYNLALQQFPESQTTSTITETAFLKILKNKALVLNILENREESINTVNQALRTLDTLKPSFKNNTDKLFLIDEAFPIFESGLEACYNLYKQTKQDSLINLAFFYAEKSKSVLLLESLFSTKATKFANIPKDIIEQEQLLKSQINFTEKKINKSESNTLQDELFELKHQYRTLLTTIETNYKSYYNLKYNSQVISVSELQNQLKPEDVLLSYFYGNHAIYTIAITKKTKTIKQYKIEKQTEKEIVSIYKMLTNPKSNLKILNSKSYNLYKKLIAPSLVNLKKKNLIIIADGLLNYIPFSSLNTNSNQSKYLIESYAVSYVNSATLLNQLSDNKTINNKVLAFAPSFNNASSKLLPLPNNITEATNILEVFKGKTLINKDATLSNFNTESSKYGILHFATHAILNDENPEYSYLAFQPNTKNNSLLYVSDLYNTNLNTNLVTLSACESGIGDLKRGEGFVSLARGFYFSGVSSICSTLWKINDGSSLKIMNSFYKNISKGKPKNIALQQAQLFFISENNQNTLVHPYYWSGFVISGNTIALTTTNYWPWLGIFPVLILALLFFIKRKY